MTMNSIQLNNDNEDFGMVESTKMLRTNIEFSGINKKVIVFTSCAPNEGKSTVSLELAKSFADNGEKVLYIDADLRRSVFVGVHGITGKFKGLSHFLSGKAEMREVVNRTQNPKLMVIMAGVTPPNPSELLGNERFVLLLKKMRDIYDRIIIDSPPLGSVIDAAIIAKNCDGAILVIESNAIKYKLAKLVKEQLELSGCSIMGAVLNEIKPNKLQYYGYEYR